MVRKMLRSRKVSKLKRQSNPIIGMALDHLDRPTDLKDIFHLNLTCDFDTLVGNQEAALICDKYDPIIAMDIRLATLRFFGSHNSSHVFQCLSYIPELLKDQRALRSLHTYFNRLGLHDFAEDLLGDPNFNLKKKNKRELIKSLFTSTSAPVSKSKQESQGLVIDNLFPEDMINLDLNHLSERIVRHLSRMTLSEFMNDILEVLKTPKIEIRRRREILYISGELIIDQSIENALSLLKETELFVKDARFSRRVAQSLEKWHRSEKAIEILSYASDQTSQRLRLAIEQRHQWKKNGYDIDYLEPVSDYRPIKDRVLYHIHASLNHTTSGYSTRTHHICKALIEQGVDLHVRTRWGYPCDRKEIDLKPEDVLTEVIDNVTYLHDPIEEGFGAYAMEDYAQRAAHSLLRTALELKPSVIHAASNHSVGFSAAMVARALGIPFVYEMRGLWALSRAAKDPIYRQQDRFQLEMALEKHVALAADHVIVITDGLRAQLIDWGIPEEKISLAPNGVDTSRFKVQKRHQKLEQELMLNGKIVIGYVGSLLKYEGLDYLLDAVATFPDQLKKNIAVLIVGDGEHRKVLEQQTKHHHLEQIVKFVGRVPLEEVSSYYSLIDISPFPRISAEVCEMISPLKPLEAMAMGSVVLASNVRAIAEHVIPGRNGILFEKESSTDLARKLKHLISNPDEITDLSIQARDWVENRRNWPLITSFIENVYDYVLNKKDLEHWQLDVLPAILRDGSLTGIPLEPHELLLQGPYIPNGLEEMNIKYEHSTNWRLSHGAFELGRSPSDEESLAHRTEWLPELPVPTVCVGSELMSKIFQDKVLPEHYLKMNACSFFICDQFTSEKQITHAIMNFSVLISERTEYLLGFVGIISEQQYISPIFDFMKTHGEEHRFQRKENWRRLMLTNHPLLKLLNNSFDRSHLRFIDPMEYTMMVDVTKVKNIHSLVSQILCQRVLPKTILFTTDRELLNHLEIILNSFIVNGIKVQFLGTHKPPKDVLMFSDEINEHSGLDFCLTRLFRAHDPLRTLDTLPLLSPARINLRVLVIGHDLKFIRNIYNIWDSWGLKVTLLQSRNHNCDLSISDQELIALVANHDVIFCEWALGNVMKMASIRGVRPLFIRYHLQERNTEYLLKTELNENDRISFVSSHTREDESRLDPQTDILVTPNAVDCLELNIERSNPNSLGLMGITPQRKRIDFALEAIKQLHEQKITHKLIIKGKLPKDFPWMKHRVMENKWYQDNYEDYQDLFARSQIVQEGFTPDIGTFFASISSLFSVSAFESFHLAPVEAAAARAGVLMLPWVGAEQIHKSNWICTSTEDMVMKYQQSITTGLGYETGEENRQFVMENYELRSVAFRLYVEMTRNVVDRRDSSAPSVKPAHVFRNLMPRIVEPGKQMYIRSLTHEENSLPMKVDGELRLIGKESQKVIILSAHMDLNLIDGSSIWYVSMASMLALTGAHVVCPISSNALYSPIVQPLIDNPNVTLITPEMMEMKKFGRKLSLEQYIRIVNDISRWYGESNIIVARGFELIQELTEMSKNVVVWAYLTDYYTHEEDGKSVIRPNTNTLIKRVIQQNGRILSQTTLIAEELAKLGNIERKEIIPLPPMIPTFKSREIKKSSTETINIVYAGKIAPLWGVEPLLDLLDDKFMAVVIGDKIHRGPAHDSMFQSRLQKKIEFSDCVVWIPRLPREQVLDHLSQANLAWCARDPYFESQTRELSTKILEAILTGTPPIVTRSKLHEELLGKDWPFMLESPQDPSWKKDTAAKISKSEKQFAKLQKKLIDHDVTTVSNRFKQLIAGVDI